MRGRSARLPVLLATVLVLAAVAARADGQEPSVRLEGVEVALWPEYDRPSMLVIYRLVLSADVSLPAPMVVSLPAAVGLPNAVAERVADRLVNLAYDRVVSGEVAQLRFVANSAVVQVEYYDPALAIDGQRRTFEYRWPGDYAAAALDVVVQHPPGAADVKIEPPAADAEMGNDGLRYQRLDLGAVAAGQTIAVSLNYDRDQESLTSTLVPPPAPAGVQASTPASLPAGSPMSASYLVMAILLAFGLAGLAMGVLLRLRGGGRGRPAGAAFCTRCGKSVRPGDRFCGKCGARTGS